MSGRTLVTLVNGNQFYVSEPFFVQTDIYGFLYVKKKEVNDVNGIVQFTPYETYNPHAWVSFQWQEDEEKKEQ